MSEEKKKDTPESPSAPGEKRRTFIKAAALLTPAVLTLVSRSSFGQAVTPSAAASAGSPGRVTGAADTSQILTDSTTSPTALQ